MIILCFLKIILFAMVIGLSDLRSMESLCKYNIRFMYIAQEETSGFTFFERLKKDCFIDDND